MSNWFTRRVDFWKRAFYNKVRAVLGTLITVFTVALIIRDGVLDPGKRDWVLLKFIPSLPWYWWAITGLTALLYLVLEGAYAEHKAELANYRKRYKTRLVEIRRDHRAELTAAQLGSLIGVNRQPPEEIPAAQELEEIQAPPDIEDKTRPLGGIESMPPSGGELIEAALANPERIFVNVTVAYLMEQFDGRTTAEAHRIVGPYVGKWVKVRAPVNDVQEHGRETQITLSPKIESRQTLINPGYILVWGTSQSWKSRASILKRGDIVHAEGQILRIDAFAVTLARAEFLQTEDKFGDTPARLRVGFDKHYDQTKDQNITHHRFQVFNGFLPVAQKVQAHLVDIKPRPKAEVFAADFPYRLKTKDGDDYASLTPQSG